MQHLSWANVKKEVVNDSMSRQVITGERAMIASIVIKKDGLVPAHHHESEQLSYCLEGSIKFQIEGKEITLHPGEVLVIPSNIPHSALATEDFRGLEIFSPIRHDWLAGTDDYLRKK